jgi:glycerol-3-phosphate dehydrogenase
VNYCEAQALQYTDGKVSGLLCEDTLTGKQYRIRARCVVNAAGVWVDALREQDGPAHQAAGGQSIRAMVAPSQGVHIVVDREFLGGDTALMVPKTADGRVLFAVPWLGKVILGTTDTPRHDLPLEPLPFEEELEFILGESARYLRKAPTRADIKSIWVGLRPLVKPPSDAGESTKALSREHTVLVSRSGLVTVTGGKWTTYRAMAEDVLEKCMKTGLLQPRSPCVTDTLALVGTVVDRPEPAGTYSISQTPDEHAYGCEAPVLQTLPGADDVLAPGLTQAMVRFAARYEYAMTVEDMLARRSRLLFLDARTARALARQVAEILQQETGCDPKLGAFLTLADQYLHIPSKKS